MMMKNTSQHKWTEKSHTCIGQQRPKTETWNLMELMTREAVILGKDVVRNMATWSIRWLKLRDV